MLIYIIGLVVVAGAVFLFKRRQSAKIRQTYTSQRSEPTATPEAAPTGSTKADPPKYPNRPSKIN